MCRCPPFLSCTVKKKKRNIRERIWWKLKLYICVEQAYLECLLFVYGFIDPIKLKEKKNSFQAVAMLGSALHNKQPSSKVKLLTALY